jgi:hypothetical protein
MSSTADEGSRSLSNVGLPRTDWESLFWAVFAASENPMAIVDANGGSFRRTARCSACCVAPKRRSSAGRSTNRFLLPINAPLLIAGGPTLARGEGHGVEDLVVDHDLHTTVSYAAHVAHIGGRLVILVVLMADRERDGAAAGSDSPPHR